MREHADRCDARSTVPDRLAPSVRIRLACTCGADDYNAGFRDAVERCARVVRDYEVRIRGDERERTYASILRNLGSKP